MNYSVTAETAVPGDTRYQPDRIWVWGRGKSDARDKALRRWMEWGYKVAIGTVQVCKG